MQVEAIDGHGKLNFVTPLQPMRDPIRVMINVPDAAFEKAQSTHVLSTHVLPGEVYQMAEEMGRKTEEILNAPLPPDEELPELTRKQLERIEAFALREDR